MLKTTTIYSLITAALLTSLQMTANGQSDCNRVPFASGDFNSSDALTNWTTDANWVYVDANQLIRNSRDNVTGNSILSQALTNVPASAPVTVTFTYRFAEGTETATLNDSLSVLYGTIPYLSIHSTPNASGSATFTAMNGAMVSTSGTLIEGNNIAVTLTLPAGQPASGTLAFNFHTEDYPGSQTNDDIVLDDISLLGDCIAFPCNYSSTAQILNKTVSNKKRTSLEQVDITSGSLSPYYNYFATDNVSTGNVINATGYNLLDGCVYGYVSGTTGEFVKIDATGSVTTFTVPNIIALDYNVGDVTPDGYYYFTSGQLNKYYCVDLNPARTATYRKMVDPVAGFVEDLTPFGTSFSANALSSGQIEIADWAYDPTNGLFLAIFDMFANAAHQRRLMTMNPLTGTVTVGSAVIAGAGIGTETGGFGAQYMGPNNYFLVYGNSTGNYYKVDIANNTSTLIINGSSNTSNDGSRCALAPFVATDFGDMNSFMSGTVTYPTGYAEMLGGDVNSDNKPDNINGVWFGQQVSNDYNTDYRVFGSQRAVADGFDDGFQITGNTPDAQGNPTNILVSGQTYTFNLNATGNSTGTAQWGMWFDVNGDGDFTDAEDIFMNGNISLTGTSTNGAAFPVTIPASAISEGRIRFAVTRAASNPFLQSDREIYLTNGEIEDYFVTYTTPLPVKLIDFDVRKSDDNALVQWTTGSEQNTEKFIVEHSNNGLQFMAVGTVGALGNSDIEHGYSFKHSLPGNGHHYYRLKIMDQNGSFSYSQVRVLNLGDATPAILMYPNPVAGSTTITGLNAADELRVLSADGRFELSKIATGSSSVIDMSNFTAGFHIVQIVRNGAIIAVIKTAKL